MTAEPGIQAAVQVLDANEDLGKLLDAVLNDAAGADSDHTATTTAHDWPGAEVRPDLQGESQDSLFPVEPLHTFG